MNTRGQKTVTGESSLKLLQGENESLRELVVELESKLAQKGDGASEEIMKFKEEQAVTLDALKT